MLARQLNTHSNSDLQDNSADRYIPFWARSWVILYRFDLVYRTGRRFEVGKAGGLAFRVLDLICSRAAWRSRSLYLPLVPRGLIAKHRILLVFRGRYSVVNVQVEFFRTRRYFNVIFWALLFELKPSLCVSRVLDRDNFTCWADPTPAANRELIYHTACLIGMGVLGDELPS